MTIELGQSCPGFSVTYSQEINVSYSSISLGFNKTKTSVNTACAMYEFTIKEHSRYLKEHISCT